MTAKQSPRFQIPFLTHSTKLKSTTTHSKQKLRETSNSRRFDRSMVWYDTMIPSEATKFDFLWTYLVRDYTLNIHWGKSGWMWCGLSSVNQVQLFGNSACRCWLEDLRFSFRRKLLNEFPIFSNASSLEMTCHWMPESSRLKNRPP